MLKKILIAVIALLIVGVFFIPQIALCYPKTGKPENVIKWYESFRQKYPHHRWRDQAQKRIENLKANLL